MISLTENAAKEILKIMQESELHEEVCLRVGVKGGGCSGFTIPWILIQKKPSLT